ncbi:MAG: hypothetical protein HPY74_04735 [Firmicutes bacterium]|nr:hypothetical protein [Bacillota bacterium]
MGIKTAINKNIKKIVTELSKLNNHTKTAIKWGINIFLVFFALGTLLVVLNRIVFNYGSYIEFIATSIIKASFTILAEIIIGSLLVDYVFNKS